MFVVRKISMKEIRGGCKYLWISYTTTGVKKPNHSRKTGDRCVCFPGHTSNVFDASVSVCYMSVIRSFVAIPLIELSSFTFSEFSTFKIEFIIGSGRLKLIIFVVGRVWFGLNLTALSSCQFHVPISFLRVGFG